MPRPGVGNPGNSGGKKKKSGRKGFSHEKVIQLSYDIVEKELKGKPDKEITRKDKFNAAVELVKKALPNNIKLDPESLNLMFHGIFNSTSKTREDNKEQRQI